MSGHDGLYHCAFCGRTFDYDDFVSDCFSVHEEHCERMVEAIDELADLLMGPTGRERN